MTMHLPYGPMHAVLRVARIDPASFGRGGPYLVGCEVEFADPAERRAYTAAVLRHARETGQGARAMKPGESIGRGVRRRDR